MVNKWIRGLSDRLVVVLCALIFSQAPAIMGLYTAELRGRVAELKNQIAGMTQIAQLSHKTLAQYVLKFRQSEDTDFQHQGELMERTVQRHDRFSQGLGALENASAFQRPWLFAYYFNAEVFRSAWSHFQPSLPLTVEAALYAALGMGIGYVLFQSLLKILRSITKVGLKLSSGALFFRAKKPT